MRGVGPGDVGLRGGGRVTTDTYHLVQAGDGVVSCADCGDVLLSGLVQHLFCVEGMERRARAVLARPAVPDSANLGTMWWAGVLALAPEGERRATARMVWEMAREAVTRLEGLYR